MTLTVAPEGAAAPIDPFGPLEDGQYVDDVVTVVAHHGPRPRLDLRVVRTEHFDVWTHDGHLVVRHQVPDHLVDDSLTFLLDAELFGPGWVGGHQLFERLFTGVVRTSRADPMDAWALFYLNSRRRLAEATACPESAASPGLAERASIYAHADALVPVDGSVLELGSCFGFLAMHLARVPTRRVVATDVSAGSMRLLGAMSRRLAVPLETGVVDAARVPRPDASVDTVVLVHLLEHLEPHHGDAAVAEAVRVAARRVVVAVPFEVEATSAFGHVRTLDAADLRSWGAGATGWSATVHEHRGGWLVLDRR